MRRKKKKKIQHGQIYSSSYEQSSLVSMKNYEYLKKFSSEHSFPWPRRNATEMEKFLGQEK